MERTKLHKLMNECGITDTALARESGVSLRHVNYIKLAEREPTRLVMARLLAACRRLSNRRQLSITDIFDFSVPRDRRAA
jgi:predicted transcriptional regulator